MVQFSSLFEGLAKSVSFKGSTVKTDKGREAAETLADEARKNHLILRCPGETSSRCKHVASVFTKKGEKGLNQDCLTVWEKFGYQQDMTFCGVYDGHGAWGHFVAKWGDFLTVANVGDSRAVLATTNEEGNLIPVQLTVDLKPNLPEEAERIARSGGRVICSDDEAGVYRVWPPNKGPGLALSRAFGDHSLKKYGLISEPQVMLRHININDQFVILATDGVWDVISNEEALQIVSSAPAREHSAKRLVKYAASAWKSKRPGIAMDDISAICLYLHPSPC